MSHQRSNVTVPLLRMKMELTVLRIPTGILLVLAINWQGWNLVRSQERADHFQPGKIAITVNGSNKTELHVYNLYIDKIKI
jgi:hypothetical protein